MKNPRLVIGVVVTGVVLATIVMLVFAASSAFRERCEVCITFHGRTECREAYGPTREEAISTATDNACAMLASGMTDSVSCSNTRPSRVTCPD